MIMLISKNRIISVISVISVSSVNSLIRVIRVISMVFIAIVTHDADLRVQAGMAGECRGDQLTREPGVTGGIK